MTTPSEFKLLRLRECPMPEDMQIADTPVKAAEYWRAAVVGGANYNPDVECFVVLLVNSRRRVTGHVLVSTGTLDTILVHPRERADQAMLDLESLLIAGKEGQP